MIGWIEETRPYLDCFIKFLQAPSMSDWLWALSEVPTPFQPVESLSCVLHSAEQKLCHTIRPWSSIMVGRIWPSAAADS